MERSMDGKINRGKTNGQTDQKQHNFLCHTENEYSGLFT